MRRGPTIDDWPNPLKIKIHPKKKQNSPKNWLSLLAVVVLSIAFGVWSTVCFVQFLGGGF